MARTTERLPGFFWLPDEEGPRVAGHLVLEPASCRAELVGSLSPDSGFGPATPRYARVLGQLHASVPGAGTEVTLLDAFATKLSWGPHLGSKLETIVANSAFVGVEHVTAGQLFEGANVELTGLASWVPGVVVDMQTPRHLEALPEKRPSFRLDDATVIEFPVQAWVSLSFEAQTISRRARVEIRTASPSTEQVLSRVYLNPLRNLVTLATNVQAAITAVDLVLENREPWPIVVRLLVPDRREGIDDDDQGRDDHLFPFPDEAVLRAWWALSNAHRRVLGLIFGLLERPPFFSEMRFEMTFQALDLVRTRLASVDTLEALVERLGAPIVKLIPDAGAFAGEIRAVRQELWNEDVPKGMRLYYLTEVMTWVLKLSLAVACGVPLASLEKSRALARAIPLRAKLDETGH